MDEMAIDVQQCCAVRLAHDVGIPNFVEDGLCSHT